MATIRLSSNKRGTTINIKAGKGGDLTDLLYALAGQKRPDPDVDEPPTSEPTATTLERREG